MQKKRKLKTWVKITLLVLLSTILSLILCLLIKKGVNDFEELARQCDQERGYTCSYYEVRQYSLGK